MPRPHIAVYVRHYPRASEMIACQITQPVVGNRVRARVLSYELTSCTIHEDRRASPYYFLHSPAVAVIVVGDVCSSDSRADLPVLCVISELARGRIRSLVSSVIIDACAKLVLRLISVSSDRLRRQRRVRQIIPGRIPAITEAIVAVIL